MLWPVICMGGGKGGGGGVLYPESEMKWWNPFQPK